MDRISIAIIFCCYNRIEKTKKCLESLLTDYNKNKYKIHLFICDDLSTDGTYEYLKQNYSDQTIFQSKGNLFWCKSMNAAMSIAAKEYFDFYLMINDDVVFKENVLDELINTYKQTEGDCSVTGVTVSSKDESITYGGSCYKHRKLLGFDLCYNNKWFVQPDATRLVECDLSNWNCFLVPRSIIDSVGIIDGKYQHGYGDFDFSLRMQKAGKKQYITQHNIGYCENNLLNGTYFDASTRRIVRIKKMFDKKHMPIYSHYRFHWRNFGVIGVLQVTWSYIKNIYKILRKSDIA